MNIAVYLGAREPKNDAYAKAADELGAWIGMHGHRLVYGGSKDGLMGTLASAVLAAGGAVTGVEPQMFIDRSLQLEGVTELIVTKDMHERKATMIRLADMFIAFPGGTGTAEEIAEVVSMGCLGLLGGRPYGYYNINGFYDPVRESYDRMVREGFLTPENRDRIHFWSSLDEIARCCDTAV